ncbi:uncharacterized protein EI90DRAFT_3155207 [Cantharellus anzutake]|uniref:uncharacterized protein n=1 Tax=Cantharellus anzutake TaxID=1750568 RepID=UPI0019073037|nr:uncharacterized protein EI90DRAFT_3155207 [Cantharellus anzutake]KAF8329790.1 hypothetical protein EI90DRAFT_3155207 [Cantharellus anzutake]
MAQENKDVGRYDAGSAGVEAGAGRPSPSVVLQVSTKWLRSSRMYASSDISGPTSRSRSPFGNSRPTVPQYVGNIITRTVSALHLWFAWQLEFVHSLIFNMMSFILFQRYSPATPPQRTAVVIMSGGEGIGRKLSLKFASAGYTVFACLPHDVQTPRGTSSSSSVSPLLFIWQSRRARSQQSSPQMVGTIVPLVFDAAVPDECERAIDTIRAYCDRHTLRLGAVIVPPISPMPESDPGGASPSDHQGGVRWRGKRSLTPPSRLIQTSQIVLQDAMARCVFQPLAVIQALTRMLRDAHSHVIFISGCDESGFQPTHGLSSIVDSARQSSARTLAAEIRHLGIQVSSAIFGPWRKRTISVVKLESDGMDSPSEARFTITAMGSGRTNVFRANPTNRSEFTCSLCVSLRIGCAHPKPLCDVRSYRHSIVPLPEDIPTSRPPCLV